LAKLLLTVRHALEVRRLQQENLDLRRVARPLTEPLGSSAVIQTLRQQVQRVAQHNAWVLLSGEPGSGLELFARYIHVCSPRSEGPFVDVRVASIAGENAAVELFGSEDNGRIYYGLLEQANGGTLFLDEVGDMDVAVQARLFSTLENRSFLRVGGAEPVRFDVRVIAASHRDLEAEVAAGRFRGDLYYQLNVVPLRIPPLREHSEDVPELLEYYVDLFASQEYLPYRSFSVAAQNRLRNHQWAGNVRELKNLVQRLLILGAGDEVSLGDVEAALGVAQGEQVIAAFAMPLREARTQFEKEYFEYLLRAGDDNIGQVAHKAGIERTHLYRKLRSLGIRSKP
jgi:DNA-binding NtrC family response regulator